MALKVQTEQLSKTAIRFTSLPLRLTFQSEEQYKRLMCKRG
jgi:hypothetical protein